MRVAQNAAKCTILNGVTILTEHVIHEEASRATAAHAIALRAGGGSRMAGAGTQHFHHHLHRRQHLQVCLRLHRPLAA